MDRIRKKATSIAETARVRLYQAVRETTQHTVQGTEATDNTAEYEIGATGQLQLHGQTVSKTVTHPDGSKDVVVDIFGQNVPGTVSEPGRPLKLQERQIIQDTPGPGNTMVETKSVRRPTRLQSQYPRTRAAAFSNRLQRRLQAVTLVTRREIFRRLAILSKYALFPTQPLSADGCFPPARVYTLRRDTPWPNASTSCSPTAPSPCAVSTIWAPPPPCTRLPPTASP